MQEQQTNNLDNQTQKTTERQKPLQGSCLWGILLFFVLILIDQITKAFADVMFIDENGKPIVFELIPNWVNLTITYNRGISFGIGATATMGTKIAVVAMTGVMMLGLAIAYFRCDKRRTWIRVALVFIVAGGVGNLIDRVYYQVWDPATSAAIRDGVRDMVDISSIGFGVCNFADFFITGGAAALVLACLFFDTYAYSPKGKYVALQREVDELEEKKQAEKAKAKAEKLAKKQTATTKNTTTEKDEK